MEEPVLREGGVYLQTGGLGRGRSQWSRKGEKGYQSKAKGAFSEKSGEEGEVSRERRARERSKGL